MASICWPGVHLDYRLTNFRFYRRLHRSPINRSNWLLSIDLLSKQRNYNSTSWHRSICMNGWLPTSCYVICRTVGLHFSTSLLPFPPMFDWSCLDLLSRCCECYMRAQQNVMQCYERLLLPTETCKFQLPVTLKPFHRSKIFNFPLFVDSVISLKIYKCGLNMSLRGHSPRTLNWLRNYETFIVNFFFLVTSKDRPLNRLML